MNSRSNEPQQFFIYNLPKRLVMLKGRPAGFWGRASVSTSASANLGLVLGLASIFDTFDQLSG